MTQVDMFVRNNLRKFAACLAVVLVLGLGLYLFQRNDLVFVAGVAEYNEKCSQWYLDNPEKGQKTIRESREALMIGDKVIVLGKSKRGYGDYFTECNPPTYIEYIAKFSY